MTTEINPQDIVKLMLQYCKENGLMKTFKTMQEESQIALNTVDSMDSFKSDILNGRWDSVLKILATLKLPPNKTMDIYEQIILEMIELAEFEVANMLVKESLIANNLKKEFSDRTFKLEQLLAKPSFDPKLLYGGEGMTKEKKRQTLANSLLNEITSLPASRLVSLLGKLLKYQEKDGVITQNSKYNLFTGALPETEHESEAIPSKLDKILKYDPDTRIAVAKFSTTGKYLVTGSVDGILEVLDPLTAKLKQDLPYQAEGAFMVHEHVLSCLTFGKEDELMASGDGKGHVKVWKVSTGSLLRSYDNVHKQGIYCLCFGKDNAQLISGAKEIKIYGLKSGKMLKEFRGHEDGIINDLIINSEGSRLISGATDGMIKIWDYKTTECIQLIRPPSNRPVQDSDILSLLSLYNEQDKTEQVVVCLKSDTLHLMNSGGHLVKQFKCELPKTYFEGACLSIYGNILYGLANDGTLYCFDLKSGKIIHSISTNVLDSIGIIHHPAKNLILIYTYEGNIVLYKGT
jgi:WD40 repeat-containing protein SMU1